MLNLRRMLQIDAFIPIIHFLATSVAEYWHPNLHAVHTIIGVIGSLKHRFSATRVAEKSGREETWLAMAIRVADRRDLMWSIVVSKVSVKLKEFWGLRIAFRQIGAFLSEYCPPLPYHYHHINLHDRLSMIRITFFGYTVRRRLSFCPESKR